VITLAGSAAFTSSTSYVCTANTNSSTQFDSQIGVANTSGTKFTIYNDDNSGTATIFYNCIGY
jgi:hypothetical protein